MSRSAILAAAAVLAAPLLAPALEAPHDASGPGQYGCDNCHIMHKSASTSLTNNSVNSALCASCHVAGMSFGFPFTSGMQAQAGAAGSSHSWSALASNLGATAPDPSSASSVVAAMGQHLDTGGKLKCSTCHDVHNASANGGTAHASRGWATSIPTTAGSGTGTLQLTAAPAGAKAAGYVVKISGANQFKLSHDNGLTYFGWNGTAWAPDSTPGYASGKPFTPGTPVALDDGVTTVTFSAAGTFSSQVWASFYVSYPFLRADGPAMCVGCHQDRNQTWANVEGTGPLAGTFAPIVLGTTYFSHPVNQALNANGRAYDRAAILDADGSAQTTGDGNATNDLVLKAGNVSCMTCHYVHGADSNSLTVDPR